MQKSPQITTLLGTVCAFLFPLLLFGQNDTLNQVDASGQRQGYWIHFKKKNGQKTDLKIEEGTYLDDRKEGVWIKYYEDGKTPRIKGTYINNRPKGDFERFYPNGQLSEKGNFFKNTFVGDYWLFYQNGNTKLYNPCGKTNDCDSIYNYAENGCLKFIEFRLNGYQNVKRSIVFSKTKCNQIIDTVLDYDSWAASYMWEADTINQIQAARLIYPLQKNDVKQVLKSAQGKFLDGSTVNFWRVVAAEKNVLPILFELLSDPELSGVTNKCGTRKLTVGELAYLAVNEIVEFPMTENGVNGYHLTTRCGGLDKYWHDPLHVQHLREQMEAFYQENEGYLTFVPIYNTQDGAAFKKKYGVKGRYILSIK